MRDSCAQNLVLGGTIFHSVKRYLLRLSIHPKLYVNYYTQCNIKILVELVKKITSKLVKLVFAQNRLTNLLSITNHLQVYRPK